jgi:glycosyltransferase involved in cell wall biosynthesis
MISIIIPTYNSDKYICEAIDSILCQTYKDYEIIVIDDGSTDNTRIIIANHYPTVRYFYSSNRGVSSARNIGISKARGEFIAFLDADDLWAPEKLDKQVKLFWSKPELGLVFTEHSLFNETGVVKIGADKRRRLMHGNIVRNVFLNSYVATPTVMVRKHVFDRVGLFEEELIVAEDDNMWMRIAMVYPIELIDDSLALIRIVEGSLSRGKSYRNLIPAVKKHIELIINKYPTIYKCLGNSIIKKKYSQICFMEAYLYFQQCKYLESRTGFIKSFIYCPLKIGSLLYLLSTYFPHWIIEKIKKTKRSLVKI